VQWLLLPQQDADARRILLDHQMDVGQMEFGVFPTSGQAWRNLQPSAWYVTLVPE